jgi:D-alanine--poly(phosphoribitol) ligase subunit 1
MNLWAAFADVADAMPQAPALVLADREVSFGELKLLAERCGTALARHGIGRGDVVALQLPKRTETYALLIAALRVGALYVLIDPKNPRERSQRVIERVRPAVLFTSAETKNPHGKVVSLPSAGDGARWLDDLEASSRIKPSTITGADAAYIMFTSGSTGEPKGAVVPHQGVLALMAWGRSLFASAREERFTAINPLHFDNSVFDTYCGLFNGASLVPIETSELTNAVAWLRAIRSANATVMFAVPTLFLILDSLGLLTPASLPSVRTFLFGGEGYPIARLRDFHGRFRNHARLINVYGPTETSCICSSLTVDEAALAATDREFPSLGRMHGNFSHAILDADQNPVPAGGIGELWIGGPCVGLGYYANAAETAARFRQDPRQDRYRSIYYRSGDLVREDNRGDLWFHGRIDNQVKIRGHRIELEEIDLAVQSVPGVRRAVTVALASQDGDELFVGFVADREIGAEQVHALCKEKLPAYMRPSGIVQLEDLPRNANGKVDRLAMKALLAKMR